MPRAPRLRSVPFGWYYVSRSAQKNRRIVTSKLELTVFRQMLASTVVKNGLKLHFAHVDETEHAHVLLVQPGKWFLALGRWIHWLPQLKSADSSGLYYWNTESFYRNRRTVRGLHTTAIFRMLTGGSRKLQTQERAYQKFFDQCPAACEVELVSTRRSYSRRSPVHFAGVSGTACKTRTASNG